MSTLDSANERTFEAFYNFVPISLSRQKYYIGILEYLIFVPNYFVFIIL